jgi:hypothetical protein
MGEEFFVCLEGWRVDAASPVAGFDRMLEVQHFVVHEVFDCIARGIRSVKDPADHNGVVCGVIVAEEAAGGVLAPSEKRTPEESVEEAGVEGVEDLFEVVVNALRSGDALASAGLADTLGVAEHGFAGGVTPVSSSVIRIDGLAIEFGDEDVGDGSEDRLWCAFEEVGEADAELAFAESDGGVEAGEAIEANVNRRDGSARSECAVLFFKPLDEFDVHYKVKLAQAGREGIHRCRVS